VTAQKLGSERFIELSTRPSVTRFSVNSIASIETRLMPQAVRKAAIHANWSLPRRRRVVSRRMEVVMPAVTMGVGWSADLIS
jgi:hypothetical protein